MNCPFYGRFLIIQNSIPAPHGRFTLMDQGGNKCALITISDSPCQMELLGHTADWRECPIVKEVRQ